MSRRAVASGVDGGRHEPSEGEPADEAADVGRVADVGDGEADVEVQGGQDQELADQGVLPGEGAAAQRVTEHASEEAEDRARGPDRGPVEAAEVEVGDAAGEPARQVEREKAAPPEAYLDEGAEEVEGEHVQREVDEPGVQEHAGEQEPHSPSATVRARGRPGEHLGRLCHQADVQRVTVALAGDRDAEVDGHAGAYQAERYRQAGEVVQNVSGGYGGSSGA